eukprot:9846912-Alexandrium_andersonii.AAC.1
MSSPNATSRLGGRNVPGERRDDAQLGRRRVARSELRARWLRLARAGYWGGPCLRARIHLNAQCPASAP